MCVCVSGRSTRSILKITDNQNLRPCFIFFCWWTFGEGIICQTGRIIVVVLFFSFFFFLVVGPGKIDFLVFDWMEPRKRPFEEKELGVTRRSISRTNPFFVALID